MKGDIVHILNRGVEKRKIFLGEGDYARFIYDCYDFNNSKNAVEAYYRRRERAESGAARPTRRKEDEIVDVLCWALLPNHFHVLVREKVDGGASLFSQKVVGGYTKYFNEKNDRSGVLFQGRSKIIKVKRDEHFLHLPFYVMANPVGLIEPGFKEKGIGNFKKTVKFLEDYKYSSLADFSGGGGFSFVANTEAFCRLFDTDRNQFKNDFRDWLKSLSDVRRPTHGAK